MAQYRIPLQYVFAREYADSSGMQPASAAGTTVYVDTIDDAFAAGYQIALDIPRWAQLVDVTMYFSGTFNGVLSTVAGRNDWAVYGVAVGSLTSNGVIAFDNDTRNIIRVDDAAATLTAVAGGSGIQVVAHWKIGVAGGVGTTAVPSADGSTLPQASSVLFSEFADDAQGDDPPAGDLVSLFSRLEDGLAIAGGGGTTITLPTGEVRVNLCSQAHPDPWGRVFLTSSDLGQGVGQIPTTRGTWQADQFRNHPQAFVRLGDTIRQVATATRFGATDAIPLNGSPAVMRLYTVDRTPLYSSWLLVIDGQPVEVTFAHPPGSDLRRPVDIWNAVVVPAMETRSGYAVDVPGAVTWEAQPGVGIFDLASPSFPTPAFRQRQGLPRRLQHIQYGRILEIWDDQGSPYDDPPYTEVPTSI